MTKRTPQADLDGAENGNLLRKTAEPGQEPGRSPPPAPEVPFPPYGDLTELNTERTVLDTVGRESLQEIVGEIVDMLGTSSAVYEQNGDYALGIVSSGWCKLLDRASRRLCDTADDREALASGRWLCHESCWTDCAKKALETGGPVDIECHGGIRLFGVPIVAGGQAVGAMNVGYGTPPRDPARLAEIAERYRVDPDLLRSFALSYQERSPFVIEIAKRRLVFAARMIGEMIERRRAFEALEASEARYRSYVELSGQIAWVTNAKGEVEEDIPLFRKFTGLSYDEVKGTGWISALHPEDRARVLEAWNQAVAARSRYEIEYRLRRHDGVYRHVLARGVPVPGKDGSVREWVGTCIDITEHKRREDELQKLADGLARSNRELEQFAYVASHDLQEPLRMVASYTELLAERYRGRLDEKADKYIGYAVEGARRMQALINDLLALSRVGTRGEPFAPVDCGEVVADVLENLQQAILECGAEITVGELPTLPADRSQLGQVFQNLVANALKFRGEEPPRVSITVERDGAYWRFCVADNGIGIDAEYHDRIFVIFRRLHGRDKYPGSGIGLAIVKKIIERHGGRVWVDSAPGQGARFYFTLPADAGEQGSRDG